MHFNSYLPKQRFTSWMHFSPDKSILSILLNIQQTLLPQFPEKMIAKAL